MDDVLDVVTSYEGVKGPRSCCSNACAATSSWSRRGCGLPRSAAGGRGRSRNRCGWPWGAGPSGHGARGL